MNLGAPVPLPQAVVQGRHGLSPLLERPLDTHYGIDLTGVVFGNLVLHGGIAWQVTNEQGAIPALTVVDRVHLIDNHLDFTKNSADRSTWLLNEFELLASWQVGRTLLYGGGSHVLDFRDPGLIFAPILGTEVRVGARGQVGLQLESRWQAINRVSTSRLVQWTPQSRGALQVSLGFNLRWGQKEQGSVPTMEGAHGQ